MAKYFLQYLLPHALSQGGGKLLYPLIYSRQSVRRVDRSSIKMQLIDKVAARFDFFDGNANLLGADLDNPVQDAPASKAPAEGSYLIYGISASTGHYPSQMSSRP